MCQELKVRLKSWPYFNVLLDETEQRLSAHTFADLRSIERLVFKYLERDSNPLSSLNSRKAPTAATTVELQIKMIHLNPNKWWSHTDHIVT